MKIVFFGTPEYVLPVLTSLHKKYVTGPGKSPIVAVVTQSPKPMGRKQILSYSPVDKWAHERKIDTYYQSSQLIENKVVADIGVLAAFSEIIRKDVIDLFPHGILVIHPSLLPKYRGASPIQAAIAAGETQTGVSIIRMDEKVDHGAIVAQFKEDIAPSDTTETLRARLFERSAEVLTEMFDPYMKSKIKPRVQDDDEATFTSILKKEDGFVDLKKASAEIIERKLRAMHPWPGVWTLLRKSASEGQARRLKILNAHLENGELILDEVQLEGKTPVPFKQFKEAYPDLELK
jgi:methionyl-tRNA formyltransferase